MANQEKNYYSKSQLQIFKQVTKKKDVYHIGEIHPYIFDKDNIEDIKNRNKLDIAIIYLGSFEIDNPIFLKIKCPVCGKEECLIPYFCGASMLSGCHVVKFYCSNCNELIVTNDDSDYYHNIKAYVVKNKNKLNKSSKIKSCTTLDDDSKLI